MISIVIITKNEEYILERTLTSIQGITDDVIIVDSGSTDRTLTIAEKYRTNILQTAWLGYGLTKNLGIEKAKYDWILSLDADEAIDEVLKQSLLSLDLGKRENVVFKAAFRNYIGKHELKHAGYLKRSSIILFNRKDIKWEDEPVHERLLVPKNYSSRILKGHIHHYTMRDLTDFNNKMFRYALLNAQKYFNRGRKVSTLRLFFVRGYTFIRNYIFGGGFLDGYYGFLSASLYAHYTFVKYARLKELTNAHKNQPAP
jgi:glycosyltransferase involved in cell wall biosynthesis